MKFLTRRATVLTLLVLVAAAVVLDTAIPVDLKNAAAAWRPGAAGAAGGVRLIRALGLHHVYASPVFVALAVLVLTALGLSTWQQVATLRGRLRGRADPGAEPAMPAEVRAELARRGYRRVAAGRFVKARAGYAGSFLLHLGMTVTLGCSFVYLLTEHRVMVRVIEGETVRVDEAVMSRRQGLLAGASRLPATVTLERLTPVFWESDQLKALSSTLVLAHDGRTRRLDLAINAAGRHGPLTVYQQNAFGAVFLIELKTPAGATRRETLQLPHPPTRTAAGYGSFVIEGSPYELKAKYYASADRSSLLAGPPLLVLRLVQGATLVGETELPPGVQAALGPYTVTALDSRRWAGILFEGSYGTAGIFAGFFLLAAGGLLAYLLVPREVLVHADGAGYRLVWHAARFAGLFEEERLAIMACVESTSTPS